MEAYPFLGDASCAEPVLVLLGLPVDANTHPVVPDEYIQEKQWIQIKNDMYTILMGKIKKQ